MFEKYISIVRENVCNRILKNSPCIVSNNILYKQEHVFLAGFDNFFRYPIILNVKILLNSRH